MNRYLFVAFIAASLLISCSAHKRSRVAAPSPALDIPFQEHSFRGDSGATIRTETGTTIHIAPGSLVDANGNPVNGPITFRVREFHRTNDLFRAGIPMDTRANGSERLQTAGMIEMRAYAGKEELRLGPNRTIGVDLAGYRNGKEYDLWYLEEDADWNKRGNFSIDSNRIKAELVRNLNDSLKKPRSPKEEDERTFELVGNIDEVPYLKPYAGMKWRLDASEPTEVLGIQGRVHWEDVRIRLVNKKKALYELAFTQFDRTYDTSRKGIRKSLLAIPEASRGDMKKRMAIYEREIAEVERREKERQEQLARAQRQADLIQSFRADRLGIWNIDRLLKMEDCIPVYVHFDFERELSEKVKMVRLFALYDGENSIMEFQQEKWGQVYLQKGKPTRLVALLPNEQVAIVQDQAIQAALQQGSKEVTFKTERKPAKEFIKSTSP